jgi:hypothetical protein
VAVVAVAVCSEQGHENRDKRLPRLVGTTDDTIVIRRSEAFGDRTPITQDEVVACIRVDSDRMLYEPQIDGTMIGKAGTDVRAVERGRTVPISIQRDGLLPWTIHFGEPGTVHRIARLQLVAGASK